MFLILDILFGSIIRLATPPKRRHVPDDEFCHFADGLQMTEVARVPTSSIPNEVNLANITYEQHEILDFNMDAQQPTAASDQMRGFGHVKRGCLQGR